MESITKGRCVCGDIEFEFFGKPNWISNCHCESCRRATSSPVTTFIGVPRNSCNFTKGKTQFHESTPGVRRHFCGRCGTPIAFDADKFPEEMHFHLVCLENPEAFEPECHVHTGERLHWFEVLDELPRYWEGRYYDEGRTEMKPIGKGPQTKSDGNL